MARKTEGSCGKSPWGGSGECGLGRLKEEYSFTIHGRPVTKKNSGRYCGPGRFRPSSAYEAYERVAVPMLKRMAKRQGLDSPIDRPCVLTVSYFMPNRAGWPDLVGLMQATADLLEAAGVLENDRLIISWDGTGIAGISREDPRAEIFLLPCWMEEDRKAWELDPMLKRRIENGYYAD